jgi:hypothetical protein
MKRIELPAVRRITEDGTSRPDPLLQQGWSDTEKLAWWAALTALDTGLEIRLFDEAALDRKGSAIPGEYSINVGYTAHSSMPFHRAWTFLNGVAAGAKAAQAAMKEST